MIDSFTVEHYEHVNHRSFEDVAAAFEAELGSVEDGAILRGRGRGEESRRLQDAHQALRGSKRFHALLDQRSRRLDGEDGRGR